MQHAKLHVIIIKLEKELSKQLVPTFLVTINKKDKAMANNLILSEAYQNGNSFFY